MPNGRCRLHGGLSTGPRTAEGLARSRRARWKHGRYSAEAKREYRRLKAECHAFNFAVAALLAAARYAWGPSCGGGHDDERYRRVEGSSISLSRCPPVDGVERPGADANEGSTPALGDAQARTLLELPAADTLKGVRDRAILATLLYHGMRREELCGRRVHDFESRRASCTCGSTARAS